jgi:hypothetical protein
VISLGPRLGHELVTSEHRRHNAWTAEGPADPLTYLRIAVRIRVMTARGCERGRDQKRDNRN